MGKKRDNASKGKKRVVLSLAEFNEDHAPTAAPDAAALPTAPKAQEDWDREGGRPEYNQRGYKERQPRTDRNSAYDDDFDDRDWTRKGPLDDDSGAFGHAGGERDWGDMRRGPLDGGDDAAAAARDWDSMRRGPVDSAFEGRAGGNMDWAARKGPVDAAAPGGAPVGDDAWSSARKGPVEAEFEASQNRDWTARNPIESTATEEAQEKADWTAPRKGPVDSQFEAGAEEERDWSARKGPIDAEASSSQPRSEVNWAGMRSGSGVDAAGPAPSKSEVESVNKSDDKPKEASLDWSARRGPVKSRDEMEKPAGRDVDFGEVRRGSGVEEKSENVNERSEEGGRDAEGGARWRRGRGTGTRPVSTGVEPQGRRDRDWRSARTRSHPVNAAVSAEESGGNGESGAVEAAGKGEQLEKGKDDEWTTVRSVAQRREARGGGGGGFGGGGFVRRGSGRGGRRGAFGGFRGGARGLGRAEGRQEDVKEEIGAVADTATDAATDAATGAATAVAASTVGAAEHES